MTATLTFQLPEESEEHATALAGPAYRRVLVALDERFRQLNKYGSPADVAERPFTAQIARGWLWEELKAEGVDDIR